MLSNYGKAYSISTRRPGWAGTRGSPDVCPMLVQRRRRWTNIGQTLGERIVFAVSLQTIEWSIRIRESWTDIPDQGNPQMIPTSAQWSASWQTMYPAGNYWQQNEISSNSLMVKYWNVDGIRHPEEIWDLEPILYYCEQLCIEEESTINTIWPLSLVRSTRYVCNKIKTKHATISSYWFICH